MSMTSEMLLLKNVSCPLKEQQIEVLCTYQPKKTRKKNYNIFFSKFHLLFVKRQSNKMEDEIKFQIFV